MDLISSHINVIYVLGGLIGLFAGGELLVRGAVALAEKLRMPKLLIGLTVVGIGTSMPELLVSLQSAQSGLPDLAIGNVVGSNIANILLVLAAGALIVPQSTTAPGLKRDALIMCAASAGLVWLGYHGVIDRTAGLVMVGTLAAYLVMAYVMDRDKEPDIPSSGMDVLPSMLFAGAGLAALVISAHFLIEGASGIARKYHVSEAVIGLSLVAVGTSLPELTVSVIAAFRRQNEVSLGNIIGSNIFNILGMLGVTAILTPVPVAPAFLRLDLPLLAGSAFFLLLPVLRGKPVGRLSALLMLMLYAAYMAWLVVPHSLFMP